jgi:hypothetical protein
MSLTPSAPHAPVGERFRHFLEACSLDRDEFVRGVDGAIEARTLYPILNGTRRPSRALAVLIERGWGFRADYLLEGVEPAWVGLSPTDRESRAMDLTDLEAEVISFVRRSVDNVHSMRLDLERGLLWERLFARTAGLLTVLDAGDGPGSATGSGTGANAAAIGAVFDDCLRAAAAFERFTMAIQRRRALQLTLVYFDRYLTVGDAPPSRSGRAAQRRARAALSAAETQVDDTRQQLERILDLPSPLAMLAGDPKIAFDALAAIVGSAVPV